MEDVKKSQAEARLEHSLLNDGDDNSNDDNDEVQYHLLCAFRQPLQRDQHHLLTIKTTL